MSANGAVDLVKREQRRSRLRNYVGLGILFAALGWSVVHVTIQAFGPDSDAALIAGKKVIRFCHWQLEGRCVEALNEACRDYEKLHPGVAVRQIEVPERAYNQWVRTQLIGRTAPDLIETRGWTDLIVRYFVPLSDVVEKPNPYNDDDPNLAGVPWRETYVDNMLGGWNNELRDYYGMPMSLFTQRIYANKTLMEEAAGVSEAPKSLGEFMAVCERIQAYERERRKVEPGFRLVPIAGSRYTANVFRRYFDMSYWGLLEEYDENCDGYFDDSERIEAILTGRLNLATDPHVRAGHRVQYDLSRYFNPGFMGAQRDDSVFYFARGNAAMIATGTWDAGSLWRQVAGDFEITVFDFPIAAPGEKYGEYIRYRRTEAGERAGFSMGLTRFSRHKDVAIDFMHFLTSRKYNEVLNRKFRWFPAIRGAQPDPILEAFRPESKGIYSVFRPDIVGGDTELRYQQAYEGYISARDPEPAAYEEFLRTARTDREALLRGYGGLARRYLDRVAKDPAVAGDYGFRQFLEDWREDHYDRFIQAYAAQHRQLAMADFHRMYVTNYNRAMQAEGAIAISRIRALRQGLQEGTRCALASVILGQTTKLSDRVRYRAVYDRLKRRQEPAGKGKAKEADDG